MLHSTEMLTVVLDVSGYRRSLGCMYCMKQVIKDYRYDSHVVYGEEPGGMRHHGLSHENEPSRKKL